MQATLIQLSATKTQRAAAVIAAAVMLCGAVLVWPHARAQGVVVQPFMPIFATSVAIAEGLTGFLLWTQFRASGRLIFVALACAYAFTSVAVVFHLLVYPGVFSANGLLGAGRQTSIWIWLIWRAGYALLAALALALKARPPIEGRTKRRIRGSLMIAGSIGLSIALCSAAVAGRNLLPDLVSTASAYHHLSAHPALLTVAAICFASFCAHVLVTRLRTLVDVWLAVALLAGFIDVALTLGAGARYSVGWYAARIAAMVSANAVLGMLMSETSRTYQRLADAHRALQELSVRDGLTGVFNRAYFDERYPREFMLAIKADYPLAVLLVDVDHFKDYNDALGHLAGDECLRRIAHTLSASLSRPNDFVARYGGEEFVVVLPSCDPAAGMVMAERLRQAIADMALPGPVTGGPCVTVSIGHASSRFHAEAPPATLLAAADSALYKAKAHGRNRVEDEPGPQPTAAAYPRHAMSHP
ncbi:sensor domain-containing diguanylate cyclase [Trinickia soli]|uniref:diguanylate cyclase n=1 Tax=Trinickia soli TaxID=380675 RepID=A0A2N7WFU1_9BURK|nr:sensor domain-containing diguanylate cyclase [Trinickia soli]PMS28185.1 GGDEF domain-containing protein [Trinickia soli]CAB3664183.1 hypothetical protein LMG24076_01605 [Trinickia soli]